MKGVINVTKDQFLPNTFLFEETEIMNEYDEANFVNNLNFYKEEIGRASCRERV